MPTDPRRKNFVCCRRQHDRQPSDGCCFLHQANAASASKSGSQFSTASFVICSRPLSTASMARLLIIWKILAVMPSVICNIRRSDFGVSSDGLGSGVLRRIEATRSRTVR